MKSRWWLGFVMFLAVLNGLAALRYLLPHVPFASPLPNVRLRPFALAVHATCAGIALCLGPFQFSRRFRNGRVHARIGRGYVLLVIVGWAASVALAFTAATGWIASAGFLMLGCAWLLTTLLGYSSARSHAYDRHARWMLLSFACSAAAITLRLELAFALGFRLDFVTSYRLIAWLCWMPNLIATAAFLRFNPAWPGAAAGRRSAAILDV